MLLWQCSAAKHWTFTFFIVNLDVGPWVQWVHSLRPYVAGYVAGLETCPTTGRKHIQGYLEFKSKKRPMPMLSEVLPGAHWEVARGNRDQNREYCTKEGDFESWGTCFKEEVRTLPRESFYPWQEEVVQLIETEPDDRSIHWYWEAQGNRGKSALVKYLVVKHPCKALMVAGKCSDMKNLIKQYLDADKPVKVVIMDIPRVVEHFSASGLEEIKNGCFASGKYEGGMVAFNHPHVLVFANQPPPVGTYSSDRIVEHDLNEGPPRQAGYAYGFVGQ